MANKRPVILVRPTYRNSTSSLPSRTHDAHVHTPRSHPLRGGDVAAVCMRAREGGEQEDGSHAREHAHEAVLAKLMEMQPKERKAVLDRIAAFGLLESADGSKDREVSMWSEAVYRALVRVVGSSGGGVVGPGIIKRQVAGGIPWEHISGFMKSSGLMDLMVNERQKAYNLLAEMLVSHARYVAKQSGAPLSAKLVVNCTSNLPGVFEDNFPGYLEAGLAKMVARAHV